MRGRCKASAMIDPLSRQAAEQFAQKLRSYWAARGYNVTVQAVEETLAVRKQRNGSAIWIVRSNLVRGNPPPDCASK